MPESKPNSKQAAQAVESSGEETTASMSTVTSSSTSAQSKAAAVAAALAAVSSQQVAPEKPSHYTYLKGFRVDQCALFLQHKCTQHRPYTCFYWHFKNQRRRRPVRKRDGTFNYNPDVYCDKYDEQTGVCPNGDECPLVHRNAGDTEKRLCPFYFNPLYVSLFFFNCDLTNISDENLILKKKSQPLNHNLHSLLLCPSNKLERYKQTLLLVFSVPSFKYTMNPINTSLTIDVFKMSILCQLQRLKRRLTLTLIKIGSCLLK